MKFKITKIVDRYYVYTKEGFFSDWKKLNPNNYLPTTLLPKPSDFRNYFISAEEAEDYVVAYFNSIKKKEEIIFKEGKL